MVNLIASSHFSPLFGLNFPEYASLSAVAFFLLLHLEASSVCVVLYKCIHRKNCTIDLSICSKISHIMKLKS